MTRGSAHGCNVQPNHRSPLPIPRESSNSPASPHSSLNDGNAQSCPGFEDGTARRETGIAWAAFTAAWTTGIAYAAATGFYQIATFNQHRTMAIIWLIAIVLVAIATVALLRLQGRRPQRFLELPDVAALAEKSCH